MTRKIGLIIIMLTSLLIVMPLNMTFAAGTTIQLAPSASTVNVGGAFTINLTVTDVTDLAVWEFRLFYLNTILNCTSAAKGPFLEKDGNLSFFTSNIYPTYDATHGCLLFGATRYGSGPGVDGSGTLATIAFQAMGAGDTQLHFDDDVTWSFLKDSTPPPRHLIPYTAVDGTVHVIVIGSHDLAVTAVTPQKTVVGQTYTDKIDVTVRNQGDYSETFNLTLYANTTVISTIQNIVLPSATSTTRTFTWDTTGFAKGNYTISAYASPVPSETNTGNNNLINGDITITVAGDANGDHSCDMADISLIIDWFMKGPPNWNPNCDVNNDLTIDMLDISIAIDNFMKSW